MEHLALPITSTRVVLYSPVGTNCPLSIPAATYTIRLLILGPRKLLLIHE